MAVLTTVAIRLKPQDKPIAIAAGFIVVILAVGTIYTLATQGAATLLSPAYLLQQLQVGSFLGIVAAGDDAGHPHRPYRSFRALDAHRCGDDGDGCRRLAGGAGRAC